MRTPGVGIVITGLGVVSGPDGGVDALARTLSGAEMPATAVDRSKGYHLADSARRAVLTGDLDLSTWVPPGVARRMSRPSRLAVAAARMALAEAGLAGKVEGPRTGIVMSTAFGAVESTEQILEAVRLEGPQGASPFVFAESVANAAAGQVAIDTRARGPNLTIVQREAGALTALGRGAALITSGRCDCVIAGSVDQMPPVLHALLDRFGALARPGNGMHEVARPFDRRRMGFVAAEGAVVLVLERADQARARGVQARARLRAFGSGFDTTAPRIGWGTGHQTLAAALARTLARAGVAACTITHVVCGASGSVAGDRLEGLTLRRLWGDEELPPVLTPKAFVGQYGGGFVASAVLAAAGGTFGPTPGFTDEDPEIGVRPHAGGSLPPASPSLVTTCASGGSAAWLLLDRA